MRPHIETLGRTLSQLNDRNAVQKWSFSKCGFSTCLASKIKGKHVYGNIIVLFLQKITRGASWRPPRGPRVAPQNVRFKICPVFLLNELKTIYFSFKIYFWYILIVLGSCEVMGGLKIGSWGAKIRVFQKYFFQLFSTLKKRKLVSAQFRAQGWLLFLPTSVISGQKWPKTAFLGGYPSWKNLKVPQKIKIVKFRKHAFLRN